MDQVTVHDAFTPQGSSAPARPAVSCGGGAMWLHAYKAVTVDGGRYVQGGGCTTVGVAGLVQGGGFGSLSKAFGTAGAHLLEAEIVTADGEVRVVNHVREPELFWALKGGGGGTFGVVTRLTLATHELPQSFGAVQLDIHAKSDESYRRLLAKFVDVYAENLCNPHFGEMAQSGPDNHLRITMLFQGLTPDEVRAAFKPLVDFAAASSADYEGQEHFVVASLPLRRYWDAALMTHMPGAGVADTRPAATPGDFWWAGDGAQVGAYWYAFQSIWLPRSLLQPANRARFVDAWFAATRLFSLEVQFSKGLAGAPEAALAASRETPMNPDALDAFALAVIAADGPSLFTGVQPNMVAARYLAGRVQAATKALRACAPNTGAYVNECDYFQPDWQRAFWGDHYPRLLKVKHRYDPTGLFTVHHGVGSEGWGADGFTRAT
jgi:hypothetical protein